MVGRTFATTRRWLRASLDQLTAGQQWTIVAILGLVVALLGAGAPDQGSASTAEVPSPAAFAPRPIEGALSATLPPGPVVAPGPGLRRTGRQRRIRPNDDHHHDDHRAPSAADHHDNGATTTVRSGRAAAAPRPAAPALGCKPAGRKGLIVFSDWSHQKDSLGRFRELSHAVHVAVVELSPHWAQQDWMELASCKGQTHYFFAPHGEQADAREAREAVAAVICARCDAQSPCRDYARLHREQGFWGGENDEQRVIARRRANRARLIGA